MYFARFSSSCAFSSAAIFSRRSSTSGNSYAIVPFSKMRLPVASSTSIVSRPCRFPSSKLASVISLAFMQLLCTVYVHSSPSRSTTYGLNAIRPFACESISRSNFFASSRNLRVRRCFEPSVRIVLHAPLSCSISSSSSRMFDHPVHVSSMSSHTPPIASLKFSADRSRKSITSPIAVIICLHAMHRKKRSPRSSPTCAGPVFLS